MCRSNFWPLVSILLSLTTSYSAPGFTAEPSATRVKINSGSLQGTRFGRAQREVAFLGVPYAAPPVGTLRWKPPEPVQKWHGVRQATRYGPACPQLRASWLPYIGWSEDCLYLNVWTTQLSPGTKLPVIVYFHGGSNTAGYSQLTPLGPALAPLGVVVVSANYQVGPMGFLALPALTAESRHHSSGNYGLLDQLQALKWVRENISHFGGDPARVTVMGQSAGAVDVCLLMSSPLAAGFFQRAIMESGDCQGVLNEDIRTPISYNSISGTGEAIGKRLVKDLGISPGPEELQQLRRIPATDILKAWSRDPEVHFDAIVDGWAIPEQPAKTFEQGREMHIPVLVGSNANEATVFAHDVNTVTEYRNYLRQDTGKYSSEEFESYAVSSDASVPARYLELQDGSFAYGAYSLAQATTRAGQKAYLYYFTYAATGKRARLGAYHGEELYFLSNSFPNGWQHNEDDVRLGRDMRAYWTQFAKTGNPNASGLPIWPSYDLHQDECFELGRVIHQRPIAPEVHAFERIMNQIFAEALPR
jgi:para-nitrobenzyl esterase